MKANAPEKIYFDGESKACKLPIFSSQNIEYIRTDAFINKAKKWFEQQPETYDANGVRVYGDKDFEDFKKYMKGE